ncbi:MAG: DMT family transporter [Gammaproteobacteria bacterium]|nr:DMT family transporter [Gammaproteobacteria bacterium]
MSLRNLIELILLAALWGASFLFMRVATPEFGAIALIEVRVLVASVFLLPFWIYREAAFTRRAAISHWRPLLAVGILNSAVPFVLFAYSTLYITGGYASILNATAPLWGALVAWIWLKKTMSMDGVAGLLLGLTGVGILVSGSLSTSLTGVSLGILAALIASLLYGIAANYTTVRLAALSPLTISTFSQVGATVVLLPLAIFYYPEQEISLQAWLAVISLGVFCTGFAYILYFRLIAHVGSTKAITVTFLIPLFGTLWGAIFIDEQITIEMLIGSVVILSGTALVTGLLSLAKRPLKDTG